MSLDQHVHPVSSAPVELGALLQQLVESRRWLQTVLDNLPAMVGYWDRDLRNVIANRAYVDWFGKTPDELKGTHIRDLLGPELFAVNEPFMARALAGEAQHFDREIPTPAGSVRYSQASYLPDVAGDGRVSGFFVLVTDVTARVHAERLLAQEQEHTQQLADQLRIVSRVSASMHALEPDQVQEAIADAVLALGYEGSNLAIIDWDLQDFTPSHGRGPFAVLDGNRHPLGSGATQEALDTDGPVVVADYQTYSSAIPLIRASGIRTTVSIPVRTAGRTVAVLHAGRTQERSVSVGDLEVLSLLADLAGTALGSAQRLATSRAATRRYADQAHTDALTGLGNRRAADEALAQLQPGDVLAVLDLDFFKAVNDTHGHAVGDATLRLFADTVVEGLRDQDRVARLGGEEFLVVLCGCDLVEAGQVLGRIRQRWLDGTPVATFSAGYARAGEGEHSQGLYVRADSALYRAKRSGRNVLVGDPDR